MGKKSKRKEERKKKIIVYTIVSIVILLPVLLKVLVPLCETIWVTKIVPVRNVPTKEMCTRVCDDEDFTISGDYCICSNGREYSVNP